MIPRLLTLPLDQTFFLFGARGTGKSTLIKQLFDDGKALYFNLLLPEVEERLSRHPEELRAEVLALPSHISHVVIDEVQKIPKLLDVVHSLIEETNKKFVLIGSSARKLIREGANLLAGRAFVYHLFPFSFLELSERFNLDEVLRWGLLPNIEFFPDDDNRLNFLQAYTHTYLKEEIWSEQFIKKLDPFRRFLEISAHCHGKIINYANMSRDAGVDDKTIKEYFLLLEDTLIGFFLEPFRHSFRKRLSLKPKFYYFDTGIIRSLTRQLTIPLQPRISGYGDIFEHFIIIECLKLASYFKPGFRFSYLKTKDDLEVDLIVERPGLPILFIEIKSNKMVVSEDLGSFIRITKDFGECEAVCFSNDSSPKIIDNIFVFPWKEGIKKYFLE